MWIFYNAGTVHRNRTGRDGERDPFISGINVTGTEHRTAYINTEMTEYLLMPFTGYRFAERMGFDGCSSTGSEIEIFVPLTDINAMRVLQGSYNPRLRCRVYIDSILFVQMTIGWYVPKVIAVWIGMVRIKWIGHGLNVWCKS